ncbi:DUF4912 domain-containing protein [Leptolyngbya sp. FACHB-711]|uniref:DUF4912 domain-containing protein n=1 Tax=unclassified Leptolyngbya TaxID=2650499 RepID=UPI001683F5A9|nr:DUF4912 domain-containing protein [Cyanobacteria bacterium FACHB-502]MBD2024841.1 DUF4912 domain-containing protein [Leptolyngbya sp. FACHB-711]
MLQGKTSSVFTLSLLLTIAAPTWLPAVLFTDPILAQSAPTSFPLLDSVPRGTTIRVDGSDSMAGINQALKQKFEAQYGGTAVNLATEGTAAALKSVLDGTSDLAAIGRPLTQAEKAQGLVEVPITREKIAIIVGSNNPFQGSITFEQFARIFRGEITNWSQLGGAPGRIRFVDRPDSSDTRQAFRNYKAFQGAPFRTGSTTTQVSQDSTTAVIARLGRDGISYAIANQVADEPSVRILRMHRTLPNDPRYPFSQPQSYVYKGTPSAAVQSFLGFATAPIGQTTIDQAKTTGQAKTAEAKAVAATAGETATTVNPASSLATSATAIATASPAAVVPVTASSGATGTDPNTAAGTTEAASPTATNPDPAAGTTGPAAADPAIAIANRTGGLGWLLLPLALLAGLLLWRSRRRPSEAADRPANPVISPVPSGTSTSSTGTTLAQRTGSVVSADRLELMNDAPGGAVAPRSGEAAAKTEITAIDPEMVEEIPSAAIDPAIPSAAIDPALLGGAALVTGTGALFGLSELRDQSENASDVIELNPLETEPALPESTETALPAQEMAAELVALPSPEAVAQFPEAIVAEEEMAAELLAERDATEGAETTITSPVSPNPAAPPDATIPVAAATAGMFVAQSRLAIEETQEEELQSTIEAAKFYMGQPDLSSEELATVDANLPDLPGGYGESRIVLLPRDPQWAYAYWDIPAEQKQLARQQGGSRFALRFYDVTNIDSNRHNPHSLQQYECDEMARNWHIPVPLSDRDYIAEIGYVAEDERWMMLARSQPIRIPPVYPSDWYSEQFLTIDWQADLRDKAFLELVPPGERKTFNNPIYDRIFGLTESAEAQRVAGSLYGSMQQVPEQTISSFASGAGLSARSESGIGMMSGVGMSGVGMSGAGMSGVGLSGIGMSGAGMYTMSGMGVMGMSGVGMSGVGLYTSSGVGMSGVGMSGMGIYTPSGMGMSGAGMYTMSGMGMSGVGFSASMPPMRPRQFWLIADAELIVYGATEPDATVTIAGRPVQLNPDGTFRFQMSFQDGVIDFPILAVAVDGEQTRSVHLNFERKTPSRNTNTKEEARDEWFPG